MIDDLTDCEINKKWGLPADDISCSGCGQIYGHHNTKVDVISQECSVCAKIYDEVHLVDANMFIQSLLE